MTKPSVSRHVVIGVDTHKLTHHAAVLHADTGKLLAEREFPATLAGYRRLLAWACTHGNTGQGRVGRHRLLRRRPATTPPGSRRDGDRGIPTQPTRPAHAREI